MRIAVLIYQLFTRGKRSTSVETVMQNCDPLSGRIIGNNGTGIGITGSRIDGTAPGISLMSCMYTLMTLMSMEPGCLFVSMVMSGNHGSAFLQAGHHTESADGPGVAEIMSGYHMNRGAGFPTIMGVGPFPFP